MRALRPSETRVGTAVDPPPAAVVGSADMPNGGVSGYFAGEPVDIETTPARAFEAAAAIELAGFSERVPAGRAPAKIGEIIDTTPSGRLVMGVLIRMNPELSRPPEGPGGLQNAVTLGRKDDGRAAAGALGPTSAAGIGPSVAAVVFNGASVGIRPTEARGDGFA